MQGIGSVMIDMSYEEIELKDFSTPSINKPKYPHGLKLSLGKEELKKLNLEGTPAIGQKFNMEIVVEVVEVSSELEGSDEKSLRVELQVKEMEVKKDDTEEVIKQSDSSQIIYGV